MDVKEIRIAVEGTRITLVQQAFPHQSDMSNDDSKLELRIARVFHKVLSKHKIISAFQRNEYEFLGEMLQKILIQQADVVNFLYPIFSETQKDKDARCRVYIRFNSDVHEMQELPWEYTYIVPVGNHPVTVSPFFWSADKKFDFIRSVADEPISFDASHQQQLYVIIVSTNALNKPLSQLQELYVKFKNLRISSGEKLNYFKVENLMYHHFKGKINEIINTIPGPYVLHFYGHAKMENGYGEISMVDDENNIQWVRDEHFAELVNNLDRKPALVVLQACDSGQISKKAGVGINIVQKKIPAVLAMQNIVEEDVSQEFIFRFYKCLLEGEDVAKATTEARVMLGSELKKDGQPDCDNNSFGTPVLFISTKTPITLMPHVPKMVKTNSKKCSRCSKVYPHTAEGKCILNSCNGDLVEIERPDRLIDPEQDGAIGL